MGRLIEGEWVTSAVNPKTKDGRFRRPPTTLRDWVSADGSTAFPAAKGRYHLYVSYACPWAHRTLIFRKLKGLEDVIGVSVVDPLMLDEGWAFNDEWPDHLEGRAFLREVYTDADPKFTGRVTVPVLWDKETGTIVNNESADIIRMLDKAFDAFTDVRSDHYPEALRPAIDQVNARVYDTVNNGVYKAGFARSQEAYDEAVGELFDTLDWLEGRLSERDWLAGEVITEADWRLFTTLLRFDPVYHGHFKCNRRRLLDYPRLSLYARRLLDVPGVRDTVDMDHIVQHYHRSHESINPLRIVPIGPARDFTNADLEWLASRV